MSMIVFVHIIVFELFQEVPICYTRSENQSQNRSIHIENYQDHLVFYSCRI